MKTIEPFNPQSEEVRQKVFHILEQAPVKNLTETEVTETLHLLHLERQLTDGSRTSRFAVTVYQDDQRLAGASTDDKFLALLLDADCRRTILTSKRCRYCFGQSTYFWQKVARQGVLTVTKSEMMEADFGGRFLGKGWVLAPHIVTLRKWIVEDEKEQNV